MPNGVKYSTTTPTGALKRDNVALGVSGSLGPTANTGFYSMPTPQSGKYIINKTNVSDLPNFFSPQNDAELIRLARQEGATGTNTGSAAAVLAWIATQPNLEAANFEYPNIVMDGLVLNADAGFVGSYPTTGITWYDLSGNNNNGLLANGLTYNSGYSGSVYMDGGDEYIQFAPSSNLQSYFSNNSFTVVVAVKSDNVVYPRSRCPIYVNSTVTSGTQKGWSAGHGSSTTSIEIRVCDGTNISNGFISHNVAESTVYLRTFTVDRTNGTLTKYYVNGSYIGQHNATNVTGSIYDGISSEFVNGFVFGYVWGWRFIGSIYNIMVYNKVLTQAEITQNYNAQKGRFGL